MYRGSVMYFILFVVASVVVNGFSCTSQLILL
jgi:hypothetical protein